MADSIFCTKCGKEVTPGMQFCPACGQVIAGTASEAEMKKQEEEFIEEVNEGSTTWMSFLIFIYAAFAIIGAIVVLLQIDSLANSIWENESFQKWLFEHGSTLTLASLKNAIMWIGIVQLISGIFAAVSGYLVKNRIKWMYAVVFCIIAAIFATWSIFAVIFGLIVAWFIISMKPAFTS